MCGKRESMKKIFVSLLLFVSIIYLSSCQQTKDKFTVEKLSLSDSEREIANFTSDIFEKFLFEKDRLYDINIYFYKDSTLEKAGGVYGIDTKGADKTVLISGRKDGNIGFAWNILSAKYQAVEMSDDKAYGMVYGVGQENFVMEDGKEYALIFVAYKEGAVMALTEPFHIWNTIENKTSALAEFNYAYIITVQLSNEKD